MGLIVEGPDCYVNRDGSINELNYYLSGFKTDCVYISPHCHIITESHKEEDIKYYTKQQGSAVKGAALCMVTNVER